MRISPVGVGVVAPERAQDTIWDRRRRPGLEVWPITSRPVIDVVAAVLPVRHDSGRTEGDDGDDGARRGGRATTTTIRTTGRTN